jgi:hypothetical protein
VTEPTSEILMFQVGPRVFASVVHDAVRIGTVRAVPADELVVDSALGLPFARSGASWSRARRRGWSAPSSSIR